jgi:hypothetical protein
VSPVDFAQNPASLFVALARYKIKDTYATGQMLEYAMSAMAGKGFQLQELKNLMIATDGRPKVDMCKYAPLWPFASCSLFYRPKGSTTLCGYRLRPNGNQYDILPRPQSNGCFQILHVH